MNRKNILCVILFSIMTFVSCSDNGNSNSSSNSEARYSISGTIQNARKQKLVLQETKLANDTYVTIDTITLKEDGKFNFSFLAKEEALYRLAFENEYENGFEILLINDDKNIQVNADPNNFESYAVKGSKASLALNQFLKAYRIKDESFFATVDKLQQLQKTNGDPATIDQVQKEQFSKITDINNYIQKTLTENNNPIVIQYILGVSLRSMETSQVLAYAKAAAEKTKSALLAKFVATLTNQIQANTTSTSLSIGQPAPEIAMSDAAGKIITLSSLKGQYVLVDFWASWCGPCRAENPNVVSAFEKYKNKKFTVLGVSLDDNKADWQAAIIADKLNWQHISDLKKWESTVISTYQFSGIPYNVLIDPNGVIIAKELRGQDLQNTLASILK
jgi:thiol-disulfide isomerase/thioredoxin